MSDSEDSYQWRETYFVWFEAAKRPAMEKMLATVHGLRGHYEPCNPQSDDRGRVESLTILSHEDHSALELDYLEGDDILAEATHLAEELKPGEGIDSAKLKQLGRCDARFDIMHMEESDAVGDENEDEMFDPSALLIVLESLIKLTDGVGVDPQSGTLM